MTIRQTALSACLAAAWGCQAPISGTGGFPIAAEVAGEPMLEDVAGDLAAPAPEPDTLIAVSIVNGQPVRSVLAGQGEHLPFQKPAGAEKAADPPRPAREKVAHELSELVAAKQAAGSGNEAIEVLVLFREKYKIPLFPRLRSDLPRTAPENAAALDRARQIKSRLETARAADYARIQGELAGLGAAVTETFWLINAVKLRLPASAVAAVAARDDVRSIDPVLSGTAGSNEMVDARGIMNTDSYYAYGLGSGYIGVIDSGVRSTHTAFNSPSRLGYVRDCVNGLTDDCQTGSGLDPSDQTNHGTGVVSIVSGNSNLGSSSHGVTSITADSWRVTNNGGGIYGDAFIRAYSAAVDSLDDVITSSLQRWEDQDSTIAAAADAAFDSGAVVYSCQGNQGPSSSEVRCPGNARKVMAVGAVDVTSQSIESYSSRGPSNDYRTKPDLVGPVNVTVAGNSSDTATVAYFNGCSTGTPMAAAAMAIWRNWLIGSIPSLLNGHMNALGIVSGNNVSATDDTYGAGIPQLPSNATVFTYYTTLTPSSSVDISLSMTGSVSQIDAALWWPESIGGSHNDVDLALVDPSGTEVAWSSSSGSIYEKVRKVTSTTGTWKVRIKPYSVTTSSQTVYMAAFQHY